MPNFENAFSTVCELVKDFKENEHRYLSSQYQEAEVRRDFIDKLFEALGWDVYHRTQKNPYEQEVKVEKGVSVGKAQKRADYAFYITPEYRQPKFFCEAKKPSRSLKNADDYFQTIRYGWNSNTPVAVLTDFEEFHVLDCRYKPKLNNVLENPNHIRYSYNDYANPEKFKEIYYLFSRDDVAKNSLEKYSECFPKGKAKGKTSFKSTIQAIDDDFLEYIDDVREILAKAFKKNDSKLSSEELTEATQRTIDRIVFIRFLEDKLIEPEYYISEFGKKGNPWTEFISVCRKLDAKYNGIVFKKHFIDEQNFQGPEQNTFKKICDEMSYLNSPYDFNAIPIHILGSIYERFLGKVVNATAQRVKVEEKPEVRKAGGVYYTPKYIVDYIVENTVGKILRNEDSTVSSPLAKQIREASVGGDLDSRNPEDGNENLPRWRGTKGVEEGKTPAQISKLRFADIACGSGSFLIGVFETLLKYHTEYYQLHPEEAKKDGCINKDGQWILSIKQKQNILINNIYGVDIDNQAVEVTQLSLALKMLEDETGGTANDMQNMFHEKILPDLSKNIICGNSLIGTDIVYEESSDGLFERKRRITVEEERKLNPMDFEKRFPHIFPNQNSPTVSSPHVLGGDLKNGNPDTNGFDAIVGNPPYLRIQGMQEHHPLAVEYLKRKYYSASSGSIDIYVIFLERLLKLINSKGLTGYILPHKFFQADFGKNIRSIISQQKAISKILNFGANQIFENATTYTCLFFMSGNQNNLFEYFKFGDCDDLANEITKIKYSTISIDETTSEQWNFYADSKGLLLKKLESIPTKLGDYTRKIFQGIATGLDGVFVLQIGNNTKENNNTISLFSKATESYIEIEKSILKPFLMGKDVKRYQPNVINNYIIFPYEASGDKTILMNKNKLSDNYPLAWQYLKLNQSILEKRENGRFKGTWWQYSRPQNLNEFDTLKIMTPEIANGCQMTFDADGNIYHTTKVYSFAFNNSINEKLYYFLGVLNSNILWFYLKSTGYVLRGGYFTFKTNYLSPFPIPKINFKNETEKQSHDRIVSLVNEMLEAKKQLQTIKTDRDKTYYENKCADLDHAIDSEVYKLYGLTEEEIKIVEGKG
jgi:hypothetical protein